MKSSITYWTFSVPALNVPVATFFVVSETRALSAPPDFTESCLFLIAWAIFSTASESLTMAMKSSFNCRHTERRRISELAPYSVSAPPVKVSNSFAMLSWSSACYLEEVEPPSTPVRNDLNLAVAD